MGSGSSNLVLPVHKIDTWEASNPLPANSSGWYLPSQKELSLLSGRDVNNIWLNKPGTGMRDIVNASIDKVGFSATAIGSSGYWCSSENANDTACFVLFSVGFTGSSSKFFNDRLRAVSAF